MQELIDWTITLIKPSLAPFLMVTGAITAWKRWGHIIVPKKNDRRKENNEWIERFLKYQETSIGILNRMDLRLERHECLLDKTIESQSEIKHRIDRVYDRVVDHG